MTLVLFIVIVLMILSSVTLLGTFILSGRAQCRIDSERASSQFRDLFELESLATVQKSKHHAARQNDPDHRFIQGASSALLKESLVAESLQVDD